jgi:O-antigen/teichoic acid export membrane protein
MEEIEEIVSKEKFVKDTGIIGIANILLSLRELVLLPIIAKLVNISAYGIWTQLNVTLGLTIPLGILTLEAAIIRFLPGVKDKKRCGEILFTLLFIAFLNSSLLGLLTFLLAPFIANTFFETSDVALRVVRLVGLLIPISVLNLLSLNFFRALRWMRVYVFLSILERLGVLILIVCLLLSGFGIFSAVVTLLLFRALITIFALGIIISRIGLRAPNISELGVYLRYSLPLTINHPIAWVAKRGNSYLIGYFLGIASVGLFGAVRTIASIIELLSRSLLGVLSPTLAKLYNEGRIDEVKSYLANCLRYFLLFSVPIVFGLSVLSKPILLFFTSLDFVSGGNLLMLCIATSMLLHGIYAMVSEAIFLAKKTKILLLIWSVSGAINLILNATLLPKIGILGGGISLLTTSAITTITVIFISRKYLTFSFDWKFIMSILAASSTMILIILPIQTSNIFLKIGVGVIVYIFVVFFLERSEGKKIAYQLGKAFSGRTR